MNSKGIIISVFTKPWTMPTPQLGELLQGLGFTAIELPVRPGYQVIPERVTQDLPFATKQLAEYGIAITSVAGPTDEPTIAACGEAGIPIIRDMVETGGRPYLAAIEEEQRRLDALVPLLEKYKVCIGIQNHAGHSVCNSMGLLHLVGRYNPEHIAAVWDVAYNALCGESPEVALDILGPHLCLVNLKNAIWRRINGPEAEVAQWTTYWTTGRHGLASWPRAAAELKKRRYAGAVCLTAAYDDSASVVRLVTDDLLFAKSLFA